MKQRMVLVLSILIGCLAFALTHRFLNTKLREIATMKERARAEARMVPVIVAGRDLPGDVVLQKQDLKAMDIPQRAVSQDHVRRQDVDMIIGKRLKRNLAKAEAVLWSYMEVPYRPGSGLAPMVNKEMRAISVTVGGAAAVSGLVQPNDRVDILGTFYFPSASLPGEMETVTLTVRQDVTVLATGQTLANESGPVGDRRAGGGYGTVTLEVTPREAELLVFAENMKGRLTLALRNPSDVSYESALPPINFQYLQKELPALNMIRQQKIRHKLPKP
jgi:pilus assembly protein CpaB